MQSYALAAAVQSRFAGGQSGRGAGGSGDGKILPALDVCTKHVPQLDFAVDGSGQEHISVGVRLKLIISGGSPASRVALRDYRWGFPVEIDVQPCPTFKIEQGGWRANAIARAWQGILASHCHLLPFAANFGVGIPTSLPRIFDELSNDVSGEFAETGWQRLRRSVQLLF